MPCLAASFQLNSTGNASIPSGRKSLLARKQYGRAVMKRTGGKVRLYVRIDVTGGCESQFSSKAFVFIPSLPRVRSWMLLQRPRHGGLAGPIDANLAHVYPAETRKQVSVNSKFCSDWRFLVLPP